MPALGIHDWTRVDAGTWHSFHYSWIAEIKRFLNGGTLPQGYYAEAEKPAPPIVPDILALQEAADEIMADVEEDTGGGTALATAVAAPSLAVHRTAAPDLAETLPATEPRTLAIRHASGDRLIALLELTSPANKDRRRSVDAFVDKAATALEHGVHVSILDLLPPRPLANADEPHALIPRLARELNLAPLDAPPEKPLMVAALDAGDPPTRPLELFAEPLAVGDTLPPLPIFLKPGRHVLLDLPATYAAAWEATPKRWRNVIAG
jgi:hypothetical protein